MAPTGSPYLPLKNVIFSSKFYARKKGLSACNYGYCGAQKVASSPDLIGLSQTYNFPCSESPAGLDKGGLIDRHFLGEKVESLSQEIEENPQFNFNLILDKRVEGLEEFLRFQNVVVTLSMSKALDFKYFADTFREDQTRFYFFFPLDEFTPKEIEELKTIYPDWNFQPPVTGRIFHPGFSAYEDRNPEVLHQLDFREKNAKPKVSIVIPVFDHHKELAVTLKVLARQKYESTQFEIIVVDDGSNISSKTVFEKFSKENSHLNLMYVYLSRPSKREMGDNNYRSSLARNFGASKASGEILLFLDSDILLSVDFLNKLEKAHKTSNVIQSCRYHLTPEETERVMNSPEQIPDDLNESNLKTKSRSENYFESFQESTTKWCQVEFGWKYASTFCFSVKRELFFKYSGFSKSFCFYGFEDVEFGYRLYKGGESFHLLKEKVFALSHEKDRSEYCNDQGFKTELLKKSARLFYHQNLGSDIFKALEFYFT
ncbi:MAG: glycosyltransferase [Halobacteriovoraceae bacterium]|nr:glycosyltransferase [Halobacteriovoraceae bacterium]